MLIEIKKRTIRRLANGFLLSGDILYKRTPDLNLLRCVNNQDAETIMNEVHSGVCGPHMNGYVLAKKDYSGRILLVDHGARLLPICLQVPSVPDS